MSTEEASKVQAIVAEGVAREGLQEMVLTAEESAAKRLADFVSDTAIDKMIADAKETGMPLLDGPEGLIGQLTARVIERRWARKWTSTSATRRETRRRNGRGIPGTAPSGSRARTALLKWRIPVD